MIEHGGDRWQNFSLLGFDPETTPDSSIFEVARSIELLQLVNGCRPAKTVICVACQAPIRHVQRHTKSGESECVRNEMENGKSLSHQHPRARAVVPPADARRVNTGEHDEVGDAQLFPDIADGWAIDLDGEGRPRLWGEAAATAAAWRT